MESFLVAVNAVVPFLCYITFGYVMKIKGVVKEDFLQQLNKMAVSYTHLDVYKRQGRDHKRSRDRSSDGTGHGGSPGIACDGI